MPCARRAYSAAPGRMRSPSSSSPADRRPRSREAVPTDRELPDVHAHPAAGEDRDVLLRAVHQHDEIGRADTAAGIGDVEAQHVRGTAEDVRDLRDRRRRAVVDPETEAVRARPVARPRLDHDEVAPGARDEQPAHALEAAVGLEVGVAVRGQRRLARQAILVAGQQDLRDDRSRRPPRRRCARRAGR